MSDPEIVRFDCKALKIRSGNLGDALAVLIGEIAGPEIFIIYDITTFQDNEGSWHITVYYTV